MMIGIVMKLICKVSLGLQFKVVLVLLILINVIPSRINAIPKPKNIYWVVLAGGGGTRLWPLSRADLPKQFLSVTDKNLIAQSIDRLKAYPGFDQSHVYISTGKDLVSHVQKMQGQGFPIEGVIVEPERRDTGPAILLATLKILAKDPNAYIMFLPADPYIPTENYQQFAQSLMDVMESVEKSNKIVLLGKKPEYPATGYGYIEYSNSEPSLGSRYHKVSVFHEKPNENVAKSYVSRKNMLWNLGMFAGKAETFKQLFKRFANETYEGVEKYLQGKGAYAKVNGKSVDYSIMEPGSKSGDLVVVPADHFKWRDVGNVDVFISIRDEFNKMNNGFHQKVISKNAKNNKVLTQDTKKLVALIGVENICLVDTEDALLVTKCQESEQVKKVVETMKQNKDHFGSYL